MKQTFEAQVLRIYVGQDDKYQTGLLYPAIVERLSQEGIAGVTCFQGVEGYGANHKLHTARFENMFMSLPIVIEAVDTAERIGAVLPVLDEMVGEGLVTVQNITAIRYTRD